MVKSLDVKHINPFIQSSLAIMESMANTKLKVGKPCVDNLIFSHSTFILQVGLTGALKGQVLIVMEEEKAKGIASSMMFGMPVETLDEMACSALGELSNMIMGNTATIFSTLDVFIDITPPISVFGSNLKLQADTQALKIPLTKEDTGEELISLYLCLLEEN